MAGTSVSPAMTKKEQIGRTTSARGALLHGAYGTYANPAVLNRLAVICNRALAICSPLRKKRHRRKLMAYQFMGTLPSVSKGSVSNACVTFSPDSCAISRLAASGGTGSALGLLLQVGAEFTKAAEIKLDIVPSLGSTGAIRALADGKLDLAVSARPLNADAAAGLVQVAVLRTAFVFATSQRKPNGLKSAELARIYAGGDQVWADNTPIRPILRPRSEADSALLGAMVRGMDAAIEATRRRPDVPTAATDQDNVALAERTPGSLIATTSAQLATERPDLKIVPIDDVAPSMANFENGAYRFAKKMYVLIRSNGSPETQRFVEFLRSPQGVKTLRAAETLLDSE